MPKIKIHITLILYLIFFAFSGYLRNVLIIYSLLTLHELSHFLVCKLFKIDVNSITFSPIGLVMSISKLEKIHIYKRIILYLAGPAFHIIFFFILKFTPLSLLNPNLIVYNKLLLIINLLPIYPLDGANILENLFRIFLKHLFSLKLTLFFSLFTLVVIFIFVGTLENFTYMLIVVILFYLHLKRLKHLDNYVLFEMLYSKNTLN